jgi:hypothetical protein
MDTPYLGLRVSRRQLFALEEVLRHDFIVRVERHVRQFFPKHAAALDQAQLHALIAHGIERGAAHRIVAERDVCKLVDLMVAFGPLFETDKQHSWAARVLSDAKGKDPSQLVDQLYDAGLAALARKFPAGGSR